jgi:hypothetical protein
LAFEEIHHGAIYNFEAYGNTRLKEIMPGQISEVTGKFFIISFKRVLTKFA